MGALATDTGTTRNRGSELCCQYWTRTRTWSWQVVVLVLPLLDDDELVELLDAGPDRLLGELVSGAGRIVRKLESLLLLLLDDEVLVESESSESSSSSSFNPDPEPEPELPLSSSSSSSSSCCSLSSHTNPTSNPSLLNCSTARAFTGLRPCSRYSTIESMLSSQICRSCRYCGRLSSSFV